MTYPHEFITDGSGPYLIDTVGEAVGLHKLVYRANDDTWHLADADAVATMPVVGITLEPSAANRKTKILLNGYVADTSWAWTTGGSNGIIYASTTAGELTQTIPSGIGDKVQPVAVAFSTSGIWFNPPGFDNPSMDHTTEANYIVYTDGTTIYVKNGLTGEIDFTGTDAITVLQAVHDAFLTAGHGGIVVIKGPNYYDVGSGTVNITRTDITWIGQSAKFGDMTELRADGTGTYIFDVTGASGNHIRCNIKNILFNYGGVKYTHAGGKMDNVFIAHCDGLNAHGLLIESSYYFDANDCSFRGGNTGNTMAAVRIGKDVDSSTWVKFTSTEIQPSEYRGLQIDEDCEVRLDRCLIEGDPAESIQLLYTSGTARLVDCGITGSLGDGIVVTANGKLKMIGGRIETVDNGITIQAGANIHLVDDVTFLNLSGSYAVNSKAPVKVTNCEVNGQIYIEGCDGSIVSTNTVIDDVIYIKSADYTNIFCNELEDKNAGYGIAIHDCSYCDIHNNVFNNMTDGITELVSADNNLIHHNILNGCSGTKITLTGAGSKTKGNEGYNPVGVVANPFDTPNTDIEVNGVAATPVANTDYVVRNADISISSTDSGNTDCAIMIKDGGGNNVLQAAVSTLEYHYVPVGYQINWGAFTGAAPTVTVAFN